jgi:hypothetical protein
MTRDELKNLINMFQSSDYENHVVAFHAIENSILDNNELVLLYKFSGQPFAQWKKEIPMTAQRIANVIGDEAIALSSARVLGIITNNKAAKHVIETFLEFFIRDLTSMLGSIGYPMDKVDINVKIRDDGQSTEP